MWCNSNSQTDENSIASSLDSMSLETEKSLYGYNPYYGSQMRYILEVQNRNGFFNILVYPPPQINIKMLLHIHQNYLLS